MSFAVYLTAIDNKPVLMLYSQNRHEGVSLSKVCVRFAAQQQRLVFHVASDSAAFCVSLLAINLPIEWAGRQVGYEISADVEYPNGQGKLLRFRDGRDITSIELKAEKQREMAYSVMGLLSHSAHFAQPASRAIGSVTVPERCDRYEEHVPAPITIQLWSLVQPDDPWVTLSQLSEIWTTHRCSPTAN